MRSISIWGPVGRPDTGADQGSNEGGRQGDDDGSHGSASHAERGVTQDAFGRAS